MNPNDQTPPSNEPATDPLNTPQDVPPVTPQQSPAQPEAPAQPAQTFPEASPAAPSPVAAPAAENPGKTLGIVSLILSIVGLGLIGLILALVALSKSKKAGQKNGFALAGLILGILSTLAGIALFVLVGYNGISLAAEIAEACANSANASVLLTDGTVVACE